MSKKRDKTDPFRLSRSAVCDLATDLAQRLKRHDRQLAHIYKTAEAWPEAALTDEAHFVAATSQLVVLKLALQEHWRELGQISGLADIVADRAK